MTGRKNSREQSPQAIKVELAARLRDRFPEIKKVIFARVRNLSEPTDGADQSYVAGLLRTVEEALEYGLEGIEKGVDAPVPIPLEPSRQARRAARKGIRLDTVLRRYVAGNRSLEDFIVAEAAEIPSQVLSQILGDQGPLLDRLMESVAAEYMDELDLTTRSTAQEQGDKILRFLASDSPVAPADIDYDFDLWHVGMVVVGPSPEMLARVLGERFGCQSLSVSRDSETTWAWLGSSEALDTSALARHVDRAGERSLSAAIGEPRQGADGWRQTFREAQAALQVMLYRPGAATRCRDVVLISAILRDPSLSACLLETFLAPLDEGRGDAGTVLRRTLRAYFGSNQNVASAASALEIDRRTVERHLRRVEDKLGQPIGSCSTQLQVSLDVEELISPREATQTARM